MQVHLTEQAVDVWNQSSKKIIDDAFHGHTLRKLFVFPQSKIPKLPDKLTY